MWLGLLGVAVFAVTLPMTRLATGTADAPQLSPWFVTFGRATLAGALSIIFLLVTRSPWPTATQRRSLALAVLGNVLALQGARRDASPPSAPLHSDSKRAA